MFGQKLRRCTACCLSFLIAWISIGQEIVAAQGVDFEAPVIEHTFLDRVPADSSQEFVATVTDNDQVAEVILAFRFEGETDYNEIVMALRKSDTYFALVDTDPKSTRALEYYIKATDRAGTTTLRGFVFQPLVRSIFVDQGLAEDSLDNSSVQQAASESTGVQAEATIEPKKSRTWLYVLGGVLVAGAAAALAGGESDDDGSGGDCVQNSCTVTFELEAP